MRINYHMVYFRQACCQCFACGVLLSNGPFSHHTKVGLSSSVWVHLQNVEALKGSRKPEKVPHA